MSQSNKELKQASVARHSEWASEEGLSVPKGKVRLRAGPPLAKQGGRMSQGLQSIAG